MWYHQSHIPPLSSSPTTARSSSRTLKPCGLMWAYEKIIVSWCQSSIRETRERPGIRWPSQFTASTISTKELTAPSPIRLSPRKTITDIKHKKKQQEALILILSGQEMLPPTWATMNTPIIYTVTPNNKPCSLQSLKWTFVIPARNLARKHSRLRSKWRGSWLKRHVWSTKRSASASLRYVISTGKSSWTWRTSRESSRPRLWRKRWLIKALRGCIWTTINPESLEISTSKLLSSISLIMNLPHSQEGRALRILGTYTKRGKNSRRKLGWSS